MTRDIVLCVSPEVAAQESKLHAKLESLHELRDMKINNFRILRNSIDSRRGTPKINLTIRVSDEDGPIKIPYNPHLYKKIPENARQIVIVGAGPAGLFAALKAIELGLKPIVIERGKDVESRRVDIAEISRQHKIDPESNFCFGEGGAGTYSDGKLYTRSKKRGNVREVLEILHQFGASDDILVNSHPHIGSDKLPKVIKNIREKIRECGGEVKFGCRMDDLIIENNKAVGIITSKGEKIIGPVFLGIGHSARDTVKMLHQKGVKMESKGLAIGVRLEHPQHLIDQIQYHSRQGRGKWLPAAEYSFVTQSQGRGVYSFCMCPGGVIVPSPSAPGEMVVNGMSASARSGKWANSGLVVEIRPGDIPEYSEKGEFEMLSLQEDLERKFFHEGNGTLNAPAQRMTDFIKGKKSETLPKTSYAPGIHAASFNELFPKEISSRLQEGFKEFGRKSPGFLTDDGIMIGLESRTSSPIRIPRDEDSLCHIEILDLYPMGEGSGYAGGIVSSAIDGQRCVESYYKKINPECP